MRQIRRVNNPSRGAISSQRMRTNLQTMTFNEQNKESLSGLSHCLYHLHHNQSTIHTPPELLSQLSVTRGVRTQAANVSGISSHLQHLESQLSTTRFNFYCHHHYHYHFFFFKLLFKLLLLFLLILFVLSSSSSTLPPLQTAS